VSGLRSKSLLSTLLYTSAWRRAYSVYNGRMRKNYMRNRLTDFYQFLLSLHTENQWSTNVLIIQNLGHPRLIGSFSCQPEGKISNHPILRIRQACTLGAEGWVRGELQKDAICFGPSEGVHNHPAPTPSLTHIL
jgi:hypothetical protein